MSEAEWRIIEPLLPGAEGRQIGRQRLDDRRVLNAIFFVLRTGTPWRDLPERLPAAHHRVQPLQPLGQARRVARDLRGAGGALARLARADRQVDRARTSTLPGPKRGVRITPSVVLVAD
ncbi:transposase [Elioraea tepida]|uniref:Transposase n=1 Tax=Elioraea tepida TaxID=2843330 RepID=A0A975YJ02_9PROT|nr:transposase [Elioraea tepida]